MMHSDSDMPFFISTEKRPVSADEFETLRKIVASEVPERGVELEGLLVVGRCGCGTCPTVFFQPHGSGSQEREVASYMGKEPNGGVVGVVLWEIDGQFSQLEFYSMDGHEPWSIPIVNTLERL